jgi:serine phosphatase RsbU (regulator of sigma subunit)
VDAGHGLALHVGAGGVALRLPSAGPPVGAWADTQWREAELDLNPGDALVVVSDGILDIFPSVEEFTAAVLRVTHTQPTADAVCDALLALAPAATAEDDVTAVVVRRLAGNGPQPATAEVSGAASL